MSARWGLNTADPVQRREYMRRYNAEWRRANPGYAADRKIRDRGATNRRYNLQSSFGITPEKVTEILAAQGGKCLVCKVELEVPHKHTHVDHDHATDKVRGILCHHCNVGLGHFRDQPELLRAAAAYLEHTA